MSLKKAFLMMLYMFSVNMRAESNSDLEVLNQIVTVSHTNPTCTENIFKEKIKEKVGIVLTYLQLISTGVQKGIIGLIIPCNIYINYTLNTLPKQLLSPIPDAILTTIKQFGDSPENFNIYECKTLGLNAGVTITKNILIGSDLLQSPENQITFVMGHELHHYYNNDIIKQMCLTGGIIGAQFLFHKYIAYAKQKYNSKDNPYFYKFIRYGDMFNTFLNKNPLLRVLLITASFAAFSRYQETQADMTSILKTGAVEGGIDFFTEVGKIHEKHLFNTPFFKFIKKVFSTHPSCAIRIKTLENL